MAMTLRADKGAILSWNEVDANFKACLGVHNLLHVQDQKPSGTQGGTFTSGAWRTRELNTILTNAISGASLTTNVLTLPAGTYYVEADCVGFYVAYHKARFVNTDFSVNLRSFSNLNQDAVNISSVATLSGVFTAPSTGQYQLQHICSFTRTTSGLGVATSLDTEIYADLKIWKLS